MKENLNPRREFLKKSGLTVLAGAVVPNIIVNKTYAMEND
ncbi:twin-arginine translocation signal domain-containing protein, partial [Cyclobacterium qasimii]